MNAILRHNSWILDAIFDGQLERAHQLIKSKITLKEQQVIQKENFQTQPAENAVAEALKDLPSYIQRKPMSPRKKIIPEKSFDIQIIKVKEEYEPYKLAKTGRRKRRSKKRRYHRSMGPYQPKYSIVDEPVTVTFSKNNQLNLRSKSQGSRADDPKQKETNSLYSVSSKDNQKTVLKNSQPKIVSKTESGHEFDIMLKQYNDVESYSLYDYYSDQFEPEVKKPPTRSQSVKKNQHKIIQSKRSQSTIRNKKYQQIPKKKIVNPFTNFPENSSEKIHKKGKNVFKKGKAPKKPNDSFSYSDFESSSIPKTSRRKLKKDVSSDSLDSNVSDDEQFISQLNLKKKVIKAPSSARRKKSSETSSLSDEPKKKKNRKLDMKQSQQKLRSKKNLLSQSPTKKKIIQSSESEEENNKVINQKSPKKNVTHAASSRIATKKENLTETDVRKQKSAVANLKLPTPPITPITKIKKEPIIIKKIKKKPIVERILPTEEDFLSVVGHEYSKKIMFPEEEIKKIQAKFEELQSEAKIQVKYKKSIQNDLNLIQRFLYPQPLDCHICTCDVFEIYPSYSLSSRHFSRRSCKCQTELLLESIDFHHSYLNSQKPEILKAKGIHHKFEKMTAEYNETRKKISSETEKSHEKEQKISFLYDELNQVIEENKYSSKFFPVEEENRRHYSDSLQQVHDKIIEKRRVLDNLTLEVEELRLLVSEQKHIKRSLESSHRDLYNREKPEIRRLFEEVSDCRNNYDEATLKYASLMKRIQAKRPIPYHLLDSTEYQQLIQTKIKKSSLERRLKKWDQFLKSHELLQAVEAFSSKNVKLRKDLVNNIKQKEKTYYAHVEELHSLTSYAALLENILKEYENLSKVAA